MESFISNTNSTETTITDRIEKMKSHVLITKAFHLFNDRSPDNLLCTHSLGSGISARYGPGKILQYPFVNDRIVTKNLADAFQLLRVWVVYPGNHKWHLFLILFAHFGVAPFSAFVVISIACTLFITTCRVICLP